VMIDEMLSAPFVAPIASFCRCCRAADRIRSLASRNRPNGEVWGAAFAVAREPQRQLPKYSEACAGQIVQRFEQRADNVLECVDPSGRQTPPVSTLRKPGPAVFYLWPKTSRFRLGCG